MMTLEKIGIVIVCAAWFSILAALGGFVGFVVVKAVMG